MNPGTKTKPVIFFCKFLKMDFLLLYHVTRVTKYFCRIFLFLEMSQKKCVSQLLVTMLLPHNLTWV